MSVNNPNPQTVSTQNPSTEDIITNELIQDATEIDLLEEVETVIAGMAVDQKVMVGHSEEGHLWKFKYGSVEVFVQFTGLTEEDTLMVWAFVLQLPAKNELQLMRKLLEMNWLSTFEGRFAIIDDRIAVVSTRTVADLSPGELSRTITIVATLADEQDDVLQQEYGQ